MAKDLKPIDNIKALYAKVRNKKELCEIVAKEYEIKEGSAYNNWFSNYWQIPKRNHQSLIRLMQNFIVSENAKKQSA